MVCVDMPKAGKPAASRHRSTEQLACGDWQKPDSHRSILIVHTALLERELQLLEYCPRALMLYLLSPATQSYLEPVPHPSRSLPLASYIQSCPKLELLYPTARLSLY